MFVKTVIVIVMMMVIVKIMKEALKSTAQHFIFNILTVRQNVCSTHANQQKR